MANEQLDPNPSLISSGNGPHVAWVTPTKAFIKDIAKNELIAYKDVVCHINQARGRDLSDAALSSPPWQPNTQYEIGDVVSLAPGEEEGTFVPSYDSDLWVAYRPCVVEIEADRQINWSQAVQAGRVQINSNFFAVYMGRVSVYNEGVVYRYGDVAIEPHEDPAALGVPEGGVVYQFSIPANAEYEEFTDKKLGPVFPWNDSTNKVTAYQRNPASEEVWPVDQYRVNFILKEIDGHLTLWSSAWFNQVGGVSGNIAPDSGFDEGDNFRFDGNMHWKKVIWNEEYIGPLKGVFFAPPFDGNIPDGARLNFPITYDLYRRQNSVQRLGYSTWYDQSTIYPNGGLGQDANPEGLQVNWNLYLGIWTRENT